MFGAYEPSARRSDWDKYYGDPEHYRMRGGDIDREDRTMYTDKKMFGDEYYWHKKHKKDKKKLAKMDKKERKKYLKKHYFDKGYTGDLFAPESYERSYYKPYHETCVVDEHPHYRAYHMEDHPMMMEHEKHGKHGKHGKHDMKYRSGSPKFRRGYEMEMHEWKRDKEGRKKWKSVCDMGESEKYWIVRAELPGVRKEKLKVEMEGKDLIIIGKKKKELWHMEKLGIKMKEKKDEKREEKREEKKEDKEKREDKDSLKGIKWWRKERGLKGTYKRRIHLPKKVDHSAIEALYKDGILEVLIRKPEGLDKKPVEGHSIPIH